MVNLCSIQCVVFIRINIKLFSNFMSISLTIPLRSFLTLLKIFIFAHMRYYSGCHSDNDDRLYFLWWHLNSYVAAQDMHARFLFVTSCNNTHTFFAKFDRGFRSVHGDSPRGGVRGWWRLMTRGRSKMAQKLVTYELDDPRRVCQ